jgi:mgtE-like transporter
VYGSLGARVATALHQGLVEPRLTAADDRLAAAATAAIANGLLASSFAAVAVFTVLRALGSPVAPLGGLVAIALLAGVASGITLTLVVLSVVFAGYREGYDPDTLVGPIVTTTGDVFGVLFLLLAVRAVLLAGLAGGGG